MTTVPCIPADFPDDSLVDEPAGARPSSSLAFGLFLLLTAAIFLRPGEIVPGIEGWPIYEVLILLSLISAFPSFCNQFRLRNLTSRPWTLCMIGILPVIFATDMLHLGFNLGHTAAVEFLKLQIYYFLLLAVVDTPARLGKFLIIVGVFVTAIAGLAILNYLGIISIASLAALNETVGEDPATGNPMVIIRLVATGVFNDPNDFSLILGSATLIFGYRLFLADRWTVRIAWLCPIIVLLYAFFLTQSRGGFLALAAGAGVVMALRLGWRRTLILGLLVSPVLLIYGGRQVAIDLNDSNDTAQGRIQLWRQSLVLFRNSPLIGIGTGQLQENNGLVAHNSYVHAFAELGIIGGTMFIGLIYGPLQAFWRAPDAGNESRNPILTRVRPYMLGIAAAYAVGLFSLSRCYVVPTYLIFALVGAFAGLWSTGSPTAPPVKYGLRFYGILALVGIGALVFLHVFVRLLAQST